MLDTATLLENTNLLVIRATENLNETLWDVPGACGDWSVKDVVAHLASYEHLMLDAIQLVRDHQNAPTPYLQRWLSQPDAFNAAEVKERRYDTAQHIEDEYQDTQVQVSSLLQELPPETLQQKGTIPWYKAEASLADLITTFTQRIQEACNQIIAFRKKDDPALA